MSDEEREQLNEQMKKMMVLLEICSQKLLKMLT
jgi:hypothetical protein